MKKDIDGLYQLIDEMAELAPNREAICFRDARLSYNDLRNKSNQLANFLLNQGVKHGDRVGILAQKSAESAIAIYGIMKSGAAYVPVDPSAPIDRQEAMIRDCGIKCLVTAERQVQQMKELIKRSVKLDCLIGIKQTDGFKATTCATWDSVYQLPCDQPFVPEANVDDLAYIIYTSGSTGRPKGIMHTHRSGLSFARWAAEAYKLTGEDRLSNHAPLHFDLSIFDYFAGAFAGATTVIIPEAYTKLPASYSQILQDERISILFTVPFALIQLLSHGVLQSRDLSNLRWAIFGGEPFPPKHLKELMERLPETQFDNMYGPAEINGCSHYTIPAHSIVNDDPIPIGPLNPICEGLIVDDQNIPVHCGEVGELLVSTPTRMIGYWNQPDLNEKVFFRKSNLENEELIYYKTGDLVKSQKDGNLHFLGRKDRQIKSRGYRVELDEVEGVLVSHESIEEAAAYLVESADTNDSRIEASVTLKFDINLNIEELLFYSRSTLPWYAVPARISVRKDFPRTTTGKIDRLELKREATELALHNS